MRVTACRRASPASALALAVCCARPQPLVACKSNYACEQLLLDSKSGETIARGGDPFAPSQELLAHADLVVGNLECAIAGGGIAAHNLYTFRADPRVLGVLAAHVGAVSLANNHSGDFGRAAF